MNKHGFTLLEMLIVMVLIALIMGLTTLFFSNTLTANKLSAAARELSATIHYAHQLTQIDGAGKKLYIDLDARQYGIDGRSRKSIDSDITVRVLDPYAGEIRKGTYSLTFQPAGPVQGGTIILAGKKKEIRIIIDPVVGSVVMK